MLYWRNVLVMYLNQIAKDRKLCASLFYFSGLPRFLAFLCPLIFICLSKCITQTTDGSWLGCYQSKIFLDLVYAPSLIFFLSKYQIKNFYQMCILQSCCIVSKLSLASIIGVICSLSSSVLSHVCSVAILTTPGRSGESGLQMLLTIFMLPEQLVNTKQVRALLGKVSSKKTQVFELKAEEFFFQTLRSSMNCFNGHMVNFC